MGLLIKKIDTLILRDGPPAFQSACFWAGCHDENELETPERAAGEAVCPGVFRGVNGVGPIFEESHGTKGNRRVP